ncbi:MAG: FTR1 family protein [Rhodospirillaceae bacterium]|nr:FTR1 family protein [Rhodospirillaceae bacterium]
MTGFVGQILFVVWRESVEALLVIGVLNAWLAHQADRVVATTGRRYLWLGVAAGGVLAVALGAVLMTLGDSLSEEGQGYFQAGMVLVAAALILQMVFWMRRHGRTLKRELESGAQRSAETANWWGLAVLAMLAVAREGSETVVFLYGILAASGGVGDTAVLVGAIIVGFTLAVFTYWLLQVGGRVLSWRLFFRATEIMLLLLAAALVMSGVDHLVSLGVVPQLGAAVWDTSFLLDDTGVFGGLFAALTGYRARPDVTTLLVYALYWGLVLAALNRQRLRPAVQRA